MRIAIVSKTLVPSGNPSWVAGLARGLQELGHAVTIVYIRSSRYMGLFESDFRGVPLEFCFTGHAAHASELLGWPLSFALLRGGYGPAGAPDVLSWLLAPVVGHWKRRFDLLIMYEHFTGVSGLVSNLLWRTRYVVFLHEGGVGRPGSLQGRLMSKLRELVASRSAAVCALSPVIANMIQSAGLRHVVVVPSGCEPPVHGSVKRGSFVLVDGRWTPPRNPSFLIEIARRTPETEYVLTGSFWTEAFATEFAAAIRKARLESRVSIRTGLTAAETTQLYDLAMVYLRWAAHGEGGWETGFPMGLRTALAHGCPVLFDEELGCAPILSKDLPESILPHDPAVYAARILELHGNRSTVERLSGLSSAAAEKNSWTAVAARLVSSLESAHESERPSH